MIPLYDVSQCQVRDGNDGTLRALDQLLVDRDANSKFPPGSPDIDDKRQLIEHDNYTSRWQEEDCYPGSERIYNYY